MFLYMQVISKFLVGILTTGTSPTTTAERVFGAESTLQASSSLIDIFADENNAYDANFRIAKIQRGMSDSIRGARKLVKMIDAKRGGRALRLWAEGVVGDLSGFVEYRRKLGR